MATIRTQLTNGVRRVITKVVNGQRRVSCSCCEAEECCMYPALGVSEGLIPIDDLPDTVIYRGLISGDKTFTKLDPPEEYSQYLAYYKTGTEPVGADGDFIAIADGSDNWINYVSGGINVIGLCLIESFDDTTGVNDDFADTYTVNTYDEFVGGPPASSFVVTRQSLCVWTGFDGRYGEGTQVTLSYTTPNLSTTRAGMWAMQNNGRVGGGPYNSPVGIYVDGNYVWDVVE